MRIGREAVRVEKLGERVTRLLAARIIDTAGDGNGTRALPTEREICEEFGVSKTVAREVVAYLGSMRLVETHHGRRMERRPESDWNYLHPLMLELQDEEGTRRLLSELFDVRLLIEPETAARAAADPSPELVARMADLLAQMEATLDRSDDYLLLDVAFHQEVIGASSNRLLAHILDSVHHLMLPSRRATGLATDARQQAHDFHKAVFEAIRGRDSDQARSLMRSHLVAGALAGGIQVTPYAVERPRRSSAK